MATFHPRTYLVVCPLVWHYRNELRKPHDMLAESGEFVNRSTIYRWFIHYGPILHKKLRRYQFTRIDSSWQLDETYVRVKGKWHYLYRAINKRGETVDFFFSHKRNKEAAYGKM